MHPGQVFCTSVLGDEHASEAPSPRAALSPGCRGCAQALRAALVQRTVWAAPSEQAREGKSKSPQHTSGSASTGQQRIKNRASVL